MIKSQYDQVVAFMQHHGQETPAIPVIPNEETRLFRHRLTDEESSECRDAKSLVKALDGVADMNFVLMGTAAAYGFSAQMVKAATDEVCRSNATKGWFDHEIVEFCESYGVGPDILNLTVGFYRRVGSGFVTRREGGEKDRRWTVTLDGKVIKSPSYSPADIKGVLKQFGIVEVEEVAT